LGIRKRYEQAHQHKQTGYYLWWDRRIFSCQQIHRDYSYYRFYHSLYRRRGVLREIAAPLFGAGLFFLEAPGALAYDALSVQGFLILESFSSTPQQEVAV
jgi:hypothetical protein